MASPMKKLKNAICYVNKVSLYICDLLVIIFGFTTKSTRKSNTRKLEEIEEMRRKKICLVVLNRRENERLDE